MTPVGDVNPIRRRAEKRSRADQLVATPIILRRNARRTPA